MYSSLFFYRLRGAGLLLYPCAAPCCWRQCFPGITSATKSVIGRFAAGVALHCWPTGLFGIVTLLAVLILLLNRNLHKRQFSPMVSFLPPLLSLEKLMFQGMWIGFLLLTFSIIPRHVFCRRRYRQAPGSPIKPCSAFSRQLIYGALLSKRHLSASAGEHRPRCGPLSALSA